MKPIYHWQLKKFLLLLFLGLISISPILKTEFDAEAAMTETSVYVYLPSNLVQNDFQFFAPNASTTPTDCWPPGSSYCLEKNSNLTLAVFPIHQGDIIRLRSSFVANANITQSSFRLKLQFKVKGAGCATGGPWYNLGSIASTVAWRGFDITGLDDSTSIEGDTTMSSSTHNGYYSESGVSDWNSQDLSLGDIIEYDWVIQNNSADYGETYCFRVIQLDTNSQDVNLYDYNRYIEIETLPQHVTSASSTVSSTTGDSFSLTNPDNTQFSVNAPAAYYNQTLDFNIYSFAKNDILTTISAPTGRDAIGSYVYQAHSEADNFFYQEFDENITLSFSYAEDDVSDYNESTLEIRRWDGTQWVSLTSSVDTANNLVTATTQAFSFFGIFGEEDGGNGENGENGGNGGNGGGGGGGGGGTPPVTAAKVILQGMAYPLADITVLKDGQVATTLTADEQANFKATLTNLTAGTYTFGLWAEDSQGRRSITFSFTVTISSNITTTIGGIFIPPTIELEKTSVAKGETLNILGQTAPESEVSVNIESSETIVEEVVADTAGDWACTLDTSPLREGAHIARAKAESPAGLLSSFSKVLNFYIGQYGVEEVCPKADFNKDGKTNLVDFSIMLFWWGKFNPCVDQNQDSIVNLPDFSILMYWWSG